MKEQLQRIGVECPVTHYDPRRPLLRHALVDIDTLERLVATLAEEIATRRDKETACVLCCGAGAYNYTQHEGGVWHSGRKVCGRCSGTGRRQA